MESFGRFDYSAVFTYDELICAWLSVSAFLSDGRLQLGVVEEEVEEEVW